MRSKWLIPVILVLCLWLTQAATAEGKAYTAPESGRYALDETIAEADISSFTGEGADAVFEDGAVIWGSGRGEVSFEIAVSDSGWYWVRIEYAQTEATSMLIERGLKIDGETPYDNCSNFYFPKRFIDSVYPFARNEYGNDIRPQQNALYTPVSLYLRDRNELYDEPLFFWLDAGDHTLTLTGIRGGIAIYTVALVSPYIIPEDTYEAGTGGELIELECENLPVRSSKSIQNVVSSQPGVTPSEAGHKLLNSLGGGNWDNAGDYVEWNIAVAQPGWYSLAVDYRQNFQTPMTSYRRIEIDGLVPSRSFSEVPFRFSSAWKQAVPGEAGPALVWLEAGTHVLRMTSVNSPYRDVYERLTSVVSRMKALDLYIKEITGRDSDIYRIWHLERYLPDIEQDMQQMYTELDAVGKELESILGTDNLGTYTASLGQFKKLAADYNSIPDRAESLSEIYTVFSSWTDYMLKQPLTIDKMYLVPCGMQAPRTGSRFFSQLAYSFKSFAGSFSLGSEAADYNDEETINVWVMRSRDYIDMMQYLADEYYTKQTGVKVRVNYCASTTQLVLANASDSQPDIVTGASLTVPFDFGVRNSLVDLSTLEGFEDVISHVTPGSRISNYFSGAEYGIAEEVRANVMYYRTDILEELHEQVPRTWDELTKMLTTLLQNGYSLYYPYGDFLTFFFQHDVGIYTSDGTELAFDNEAGYKAFQQGTDLYVKYGVDPVMSSFYQHFRIGDVPIGIASIDQYVQFDMAASDISGAWKIALIPGTYSEDGTLRRWEAGTQNNIMMFKTTPERQARAWDFVRWWLDTDTQYLFSESMENCYGEEFRWYSSNPDVVALQSWDEDTKHVIMEQLKWYKQLPMVPGGSYMTLRELWNAWTRIVVDKGNYREELETALEDISFELSIKQREMGFIDADGNVLMPMDVLSIDDPE